MPQYTIIDTPWDTTNYINVLKQAGIQTVIRYYDNRNSPVLPQKRLELAEAQALSAAGLNIVVVFETDGNHSAYFTAEQGQEDGQNAYNWARNTIGQPAGSAIYFAVDYNAQQYELGSIRNYFNGVKSSFNNLGGGHSLYRIGAYGSGGVVTALKSQGLCDYRWISMSQSYWGTQTALADHDYELHQAPVLHAQISNLSVDYNVQNPNVTDIGSFRLTR